MKRKLTLAAAALGAIAAPLVLARPASAHPLGNLAVNTYTGITVGRTSIHVDSVLDLAELPALKARQSIDADHDGTVSDAESADYRRSQCAAMAGALTIAVNGERTSLAVTDTSLAFPPGQASLSTLRLECALQAAITVGASARITVDDTGFADRIGWREITAQGDGTELTTSLPSTSASARLTAYPASTTSPPRVVHAELTARPGTAVAAAVPSTTATGLQSRGVDGLSRRLGDLVGRGRLTIGLALAAGAIALLLGGLHALAPGHGKTLMAAYVVGERGTLRQVLTIGVTIALTHTLGVLALGMAIWASDAFAPDRALPWLTLASGAFLVGTGAALFVRRVVMGRSFGHHHHHHGPGGHHHHDGHEHGTHDHDHDHEHDHEHEQPRALSNGWLVLMGVAGGLVPTPSALVVLLGANALGHTWFGVVLVALYGVGMSAMLMGAGLVAVRFQTWLQRHWHDAPWLQRTLRFAPVFTAAVLIVAGATVALRGAGAIRI